MPAQLREHPKTHEADQFAELASRYADMVYGTCLRVTRNVHDAEDAAQECFLRLLKRGDTITTSAAGWLHTTAVHCSVGLIRKASTRRRMISLIRRPMVRLERRSKALGPIQ